MPKSELVSIILPVYNAGKYISEAIESIINQTYQNLQIIIIDDGSTDNSLEIINSFKDKRINVISRKNMGLIFTLNEALQYAKGNYIARMDADDISRSDRIEKQVSFLKKNPNISIIGSYATIINESNHIIGYRKPAKHNFSLKATCFLGSPFIHPSVMFNKKLINNELYYSDEFLHAEDYELWSRLATKDDIKFSTIPEYLLMYRVLNTSISRTYSEKQKKMTLKVQKRYFIKQKNLNEFKETNVYSIVFQQKEKIYIPLQLCFKLKELFKSIKL